MDSREQLTQPGIHEITLSDGRKFEYQINKRQNCASCGIVTDTDGDIEDLSNNKTNKLFWEELDLIAPKPRYTPEKRDSNDDNNWSELDYEDINY